MENKPEKLLPDNTVEFLDCSIYDHNGVFSLRLRQDPKAKKAFYSLIPHGGTRAVLYTHLKRITHLSSHIWVQGTECLDLLRSLLEQDFPVGYVQNNLYRFFSSKHLRIPHPLYQFLFDMAPLRPQFIATRLGAWIEIREVVGVVVDTLPTRVFDYCRSLARWHHNEANPVWAVVKILAVPPHVNHWILPDQFLEGMARAVTPAWMVQFHPFEGAGYLPFFVVSAGCGVWTNNQHLFCCRKFDGCYVGGPSRVRSEWGHERSAPCPQGDVCDSS